MKCIKNFFLKNMCYRHPKQIELKGIMLHSINLGKSNIKVFMDKCNRQTNMTLCPHSVIDGEKDIIYQTLPWTYRGRHSGLKNKNSADNTHIGVIMPYSIIPIFNIKPPRPPYPPVPMQEGASDLIESAEAAEVAESIRPAISKLTIPRLNILKNTVKRSYDTAVELCAYLCVIYKLNPTQKGVIISHSEGNKLRIASKGTDPEDIWSILGRQYNMDKFRKDVKEKMSSLGLYFYVRRRWSDIRTQLGKFKDFDKAKKCADAHRGYSVFDEFGNKIYKIKTSTKPRPGESPIPVPEPIPKPVDK